MAKLPISEFVARRQQLAEQLADNSVVVVAANQEVTRSNDTEYLFRQNSDFHYLTGFPEPDAYLIIEKCNDSVTSSLVCRAKDKLAEIWHGRRCGKDQAKQQFQFDASYELAELDNTLYQAVNGKDNLYFFIGDNSELEAKLTGLVSQVRSKSKLGHSAPSQLIDLGTLVHEMRLIKSPAEQAVMAQAGRISAEAHIRAMQYSATNIAANKPVYEWQLEAEIHHEFAMQGARNPAYNTIVGGGDNACILHYTENQEQIANDALVLIDAGCEFEGYAGDITRTFPVSGTFSPEQKAIYQLVLDAQEQVLAQIKPGKTLKQLTELSVQVITAGLVKLGILSGQVDDLIADNAHRDYYMHGLSHWLGLDVHDVGQYNVAGESRPLREGMVFTVEPGIYISADAVCDAKWHGIGVRIEDNILITKKRLYQFDGSSAKERSRH